MRFICPPSKLITLKKSQQNEIALVVRPVVENEDLLPKFSVVGVFDLDLVVGSGLGVRMSTPTAAGGYPRGAEERARSRGALFIMRVEKR